MIDGIIYRLRGSSADRQQDQKVFALIPWSVAIWLRIWRNSSGLKNRHHVGVTKETMIRWPGYFVAFGTVLPAILETRDLLSTLGIFEKSRLNPVRVQASWYRPMIITGSSCLILPSLFPQYGFPLIWLAFVFLLEPFNHRTGRPSLLKDMQEGKIGNLYQLLLSGLLRPALGILEFLGRVQMDLYRPFRGTNKTFRNAGPGLFRISTFCPGMFCHGSLLRVLVGLTTP